MRKEIRALVVVASLCLPATLATVGQAATPQKNQEPRTQQQLQNEVRHQLVLLPYYSVFDNLAFRIDGDRVILEGQVVRPSTKSDAEGVVKRIEGVSSVVNNIEVLPPSPMDDQIRRATYRAIYGEASLSRYAESAVPSIHIIVKNGHVTLEGVTDSDADRNMAEIRAKSVPNVFSVENHLRVVSSK
jgi:hyperosmotically inducible periplasmic protein